MATVLTLIEHETIPITDDGDEQTSSLTRKQAASLAKIEGKLPKGAISWGHKSVKFSQYCGLLQLGDLHLEILPKIYGNESEAGASRYALVKMLRKAGFLKAMPVGAASISTQSHTLLDIFIAHFCELLKTSLVQGMSRQYRTIEENIGVIRGKLVTSQQLRVNLAHRERLYCSYDELSEDILINQTIKYTLKLLLRGCRSASIKQTVTHLLMLFNDVSEKQLTSRDADMIPLDRTNQAFHVVIEQCCMFIKGMNPDLYVGEHDSVALLFDMNQLFERWAASILKPLAWQAGYNLREQGPKRYLAYREDIDKKVFQMRPDISLLSNSSDVVLIADAKWKLLDVDDAKLGISQADLYQLNTYATQYGVKHIALIYPRQKGLSETYEILFSGTDNVVVTIITLDVHDSVLGNKERLSVLLTV